MKLQWDVNGQRFFENGVNKGVLYVQAEDGTYPTGVAWNGLISVSESPSGAEPTPLYADNIKYLNLLSKEEFGATIEAYTYPDEFAVCNGEVTLVAGVQVAQQSRKTFGLSYTTKIGNDMDEDIGEKLHLVYGCLASPSEKSYASVNDSPEAMTFSWEITTTPVEIDGLLGDVKLKPTATITIDSRTVDKTKYETIKETLYGKNPTTEGGNDGVVAKLPSPKEILLLLQ